MAILKKRYYVRSDTHEEWILNNYIKASLYYATTTSLHHGEICEVWFQNDTGDLTEQIHEKLNNHNIYKFISPVRRGAYALAIEKSKFQELLEAVETIDSSTLSDGVMY
jgi:hypothetical protein